MEKAKVVVINKTGSSKRAAELCLASGILKYDDGEYSHISGLQDHGHKVQEVKLMVVEDKPLPFVAELPKAAPVTAPRSEKGKAKSTKAK